MRSRADACALEELLGSRGRRRSSIGHDWGAFAAYGAACLEARSLQEGRRRWPLPPYRRSHRPSSRTTRSSAASTSSSSSPPSPSWSSAPTTAAFISRLWADWSPGYDASWDVARVKESIGSPERLTRGDRLLPGDARPVQPPRSLRRGPTGHAGDPTAADPLLSRRRGRVHGRGVSSERAGFAYLKGPRASSSTAPGHFLHLERPGRGSRPTSCFLAIRSWRCVNRWRVRCVYVQTSSVGQ